MPIRLMSARRAAERLPASIDGNAVCHPRHLDALNRLAHLLLCPACWAAGQITNPPACRKDA